MKKEDSLAVLHADFEMGWRGGQQQVAYLIEGLRARGVRSGLVCRPGSALADWARTSGVPVDLLPLRFEWNPAAGLKLAALCRAGSYTILHAHSSHALGVGTLCRLFHPGIRLIATRRVDFPLGRSRIRRWKYRSRLLDRLVCISTGVRQVLLDAGVPEEKLALIRSGVDLKRFAASPAAKPPGLDSLPPDRMIAGTVAAICWHKDYPNLLRAARKVLDQSDRIVFCAVGEGPDGPDVRALAAQLQLGDRFIFAGFQRDVGAYLHAFDLFVMASKSEGLGTSLLDAQAVGLPIVATDVGGIPEAMDPGASGLLVPPQDPDALAAAILELAERPDRRTAMGEHGRAWVERFSIDHTVDAYVELYRAPAAERAS